MPSIKYFSFLLIFILLMPVSTFSQSQKIKEYTVIKGDTLWDISYKELDDYFLWPKIWKENPEIKNPDAIYPGQKIRIPLYLIEEVREAPAPPPPPVEPPAEPEVIIPEEPPKPSYLISKSYLMESGYIADSVEGLGSITGSPGGKTLFGNLDHVYVTTESEVYVGDRFYVIRPGKMVKHPVSNKELGFVVEIRGIAEIDRFEYGETIAVLTQSFGEIANGDLLDTYFDMEPPLASESYRKPAIDGYVISSRDRRVMSSVPDIVYIDKGSSDGIEVGDIFRTVAVGKHKVPNGAVQVINTQDATATAIVRENEGPITAGNLITQFE
jgi:hypothetical protein